MNGVEDLDVFKLAHHLALRSPKRIQKKNYLAWRIAQARNEQTSQSVGNYRTLLEQT
jgi:hypothetical protein